MNEWEKELGIQMFMNNFKALKQHCEEHHHDCKECVFSGDYGFCVLEEKPIEYNIEKLEKAIRLDIERSEKSGT